MVLEPILERDQVLVQPALVQPDGFQSFLHAPHLGAALLQPGEETLHLEDKKYKVTGHALDMHLYYSGKNHSVIAKQQCANTLLPY